MVNQLSCQRLHALRKPNATNIKVNNMEWAHQLGYIHNDMNLLMDP